MTSNERIVYSLNVDDLQSVAAAELGRNLTDQELASVERKLGDFIDWYGAVANTIDMSVEHAV